MKAEEILKLEVFNSEARKEIISNKKLLYLFLAAGIAKTTPKSLLNRISIETWAIAEKAGAIDLMDLQITEQELNGGTCDKCNKKWIKREFKKDEKIITYFYEPDCICYCRCMICHSWLIAEVKAGEDTCRECRRANGGKTLISCWEYKPKKRGNKTYLGERCEGEMQLLRNNKGKTEYKCSECASILTFQYGFGVRKGSV